MKTPLLLSLSLALLVTAPTALLAKPEKGDKAERKQDKSIFAKYDKNSNGVLDPEEKAALRADLATDASLKFLDKNSDGMLDDTELAVLKAGHKKKNKGTT